MKIIKPLKLGLLTKTYLYKRKNNFVVSPLCFFSLGSKDEVLIDYLQWSKVMAALGNGQILDMAMPKARAEILISGQAYAPGGKPVAKMEVGFEVGDAHKTISIIGDRQWQVRNLTPYSMTEPESFVKMPLTWDRSYGGEKYSANPVGKGYVSRLNMLVPKKACAKLANLEKPEKPVKRISQRPAPVGFGPLDITLPQRRRKAGAYDQAWLKNDHPGYPVDIDWTFFNCAQEDQQISGFFKGGEAYRIWGMHPDKTVLQGLIPAVCARAFVNKKSASGPQFEEMKTRLDTIWFFPDQELGVLIFRGQTEVKDSDALDVDCVMLAYENLADSPRSLNYYQEVMGLRTDPDTAMSHVFNESQLSPQKTAQQIEKEQQEQDAAEQESLERKQELIDHSVADFFAKTGMDMPEDFEQPKAEPDLLGVIPPAALERGDFDLSKMIAKANVLADKAKADGEAKLKELEHAQQELVAKTGAIETESADKLLVRQKEEARVKALSAGVQEGEGSGGFICSSNPQVVTMLNSLKLAQKHDASIDEAKIEEIIKALRSAQDQNRKARQVSPEPTAPAEEMINECRAYLGGLVRDLLAKGESLAGRDLAGADLAGCDFSDMDLREIMLEQADLTGCNFSNSNLDKAVFTGAQIDGADFTGATLTAANFSKATGVGALFHNCDLSNALFMSSDLKVCRFNGSRFINTTVMQTILNGSVFEDSEFSEAVFLETRMENSIWDRSSFKKCMLINIDIRQSTFREAELFRCALLNVQGDESDFSNARLKTVQIGGEASFKCSSFNQIKAEECGFRKADFTDACFAHGALVKSDLGETNLLRAGMPGTCLYGSVLMSANFRDADLQGADFFEALLRKADFTGANLKNANLYNADLSETVFTDCRVDGVNVLNKGALKAA